MVQGAPVVARPSPARPSAPLQWPLRVAAYDSPKAWKNISQYICDGTADDVTVQAALDALPAYGGEIQMGSGTYTFTAATTASRAIDNVTIRGQGKSTVLNGDAATALISAGSRKGWLFLDFQTDAGGLTISSATNSYASYWKGDTLETTFAHSDPVYFGAAQDVSLYRSAANVLTLSSGDDLELYNQLRFNGAPYLYKDAGSGLSIGSGFDNVANVTHRLGLALPTVLASTEAVVLRAQMQLQATSSPGSGQPVSAIDADLMVMGANTANWPTGVLAALNAVVWIKADATGTLADASCLITSVGIDGGSNITDLYQIQVKEPIGAGAGAITNLYGLYINNLTKGTTLNRAIYVVGGISEFGGALELNANLLDEVGSLRIQHDTTDDNILDQYSIEVSNITTWTTLKTLTPSAVTGSYAAGTVEAWVGGDTSGVGDGVLIARWRFHISNGAPTVAGIGTDISWQSAASAAPQFRLNVSGNTIQCQVQSGDAVGAFYGSCVLKVFLPQFAGTARTWAVS